MSIRKNSWDIDWTAEPDVVELHRAYAMRNNKPDEFVIGMLTLAEKGSLVARMYLAEHYFDQSSAPASAQESKRWYSEAAARNHAPALYMLGRLNLEDNNRSCAENAFEASAELGYAPAYFKLATILDRQNDPEWYQKKLKYLTLASERGHIPAKRTLAALLFEHPRSYRDIFTAIRLLIRVYASIPIILVNMISSKPVDERFLT